MTVSHRALVPTVGATAWRSSLLLWAFVALSLLPRVALALEPKDPEQVCRRISTSSGEAAVSYTHLDWYAGRHGLWVRLGFL